MDTWKRTQKIDAPGNSSVSARNLRKNDLGGVIFGCKNHTMDECLLKQLFGLPSLHFSYVKKVEPGLPLFLFNYTDRKLHGVYEAASHGQMNIDSYAWTDGGSERTPFPAQVRIHIKIQCQPLIEDQYQKIIEDNYYCPQQGHLFWFELDHAQTRSLIALFKPLRVKRTLAPAASSVTVKSTLPPVASSFPVKPRSGLGASSWADLLKAAPSTTPKAPGDWEFGNTEVREPKKDPTPSLDLVDDNKFALLQLYDRDNEHGNSSNTYGNSSNTSSSDPGDMEPNEPVSDWEDLIEGNQVTSSDDSTHLDADIQTLQRQQSGNEELETDAELVLLKLKTLSANHKLVNSSSKYCNSGSAIPSIPGEMYQNNGHFSEEPDYLDEKEENSSASDPFQGNAELVQAIEELKERVVNLEMQKVESDREMKQLRDLVKNSETKIQLLKYHVKELESKSDPSMTLDDSLNKLVEQYLGSENVMYLIGGCNGSSWLSSLDSFSPSLDILTSLKPMSYCRSYASAVALSGSLYVFGGGDGSSWYDSVERYDPRHDEWTLCPHMIRERGSLAGATLYSKIFAIGGGDGLECLSDVEMFDPALGRWINNQSMLQKRFAPAAAELHGALYAVGGYDGKDYLMSAERLDPRLPYWTKLPSMKMRRGCHSLAVFDEKLYVMGGYDGGKMVSSLEVFDPRLGSWMMGEPMNSARGYAAAAVLGDSLYVIGGVGDGVNIVDTVECYKRGSGWVESGIKAIGRRSFCSAVVL